MSSTSPVLFEHQINIYYPDGQFFSGGNITETKIVHDLRNNLYPDVQENGAIMGIPHECRCVFIRNDSDEAKTAKVTAWIEVNTIYSHSRVKFGIGAAGVNAAEVELGTPYTLPPNVNFIDLDTKPSEPQILELDPHQYFAIWFDWIIEPNAPPHIDDFFVLAVEVERQPDSLKTDDCPDNYTYNPSTQLCVPDSNITCPEGQVLDPSTGICVTPLVCPEGEEYDPVSRTCVPENTIPTCPTGQHYNPTTQQCEDDVVNPPPVGNINDVTICVGSDWECNNDTDATMDTIVEIDPDLLISCGDHSAGSSESCILDIFRRLTNLYPSKIKIVLGNHDDTEDGSTQNRQDLISALGIPSVGYYSFTLENIRFIAMDTQVSRGTGSAQYNFVVSELGKAKTDPLIKWIIVYSHKPSMISSDDYHSEDTTLHETYLPLFDQYGVNLVIHGHNHVFWASYLINHLADIDNPTIIDQSNNYVNKAGTVFVSNCPAGQSNRGGGGDDWVAYSNDQDFGTFAILLRENGTKLIGEFHPNGGDIPYSFTMVKT